MKLLNLVGADFAAFGKKDYQQFKLIERMVTDLHLPVKIVGAPIKREEDGLAMSSRNLKLNASARDEAPSLYQAMSALKNLFQAGERQVDSLLRSLTPNWRELLLKSNMPKFVVKTPLAYSHRELSIIRQYLQ